MPFIHYGISSSQTACMILLVLMVGARIL